MKKIISTIKNLNQLSTYITDTSLLSPNIFNITHFPNEFTLGKNLIKLKGVPNIFEDNSELSIEILDSTGYPIYNEIINYIDGDKSRVIAVYIYDTTPIGKCTVTLTATLKSYNGQSIPTSWQNIVNTKWSRDVIVNNKLINTSEILFDQTKLPDVTISEQIGVRLDRNFAGNTQFPTFTTGLINFEKRNGKKIAKITGGEFHPDMVGGTLTVNTPENPTPAPTQITSSNKIYSSKIQKVLNKDFIELEENFVFSFSQSLQQHEYTKFDGSSFSIAYEASPSYVTTQHSESFALTEIKNLEPATGDISRIKLYVNSSATIGTFDLINDILLDPTEIFVDATGSIFPDIGVGFFTSQSVIDQYWDAHTYIGKTESTAPTLVFSSSSLNNAVIVSSSVDYSNDNSVLVFETTSSLPGVFVENSEYKLIFDAIGQKNSLSNRQNPKLLIYLSGSSFNYSETDSLNDSFPVKLGKRIGEIEIRAESKRLDDRQFIFSADKTGFGSLLFVIESGQWEFSDIRTLTSAETGFTENYTRFRTDVPVKHKANNEIQFKIEYYNSDGVKSDHETIIGNKVFEGGNRYIDGDFSMLTGSLTVASSLSSGVEIVGLENTGYIRSLGYEGFNQATGSGPGGFLLFSGSALPNQSSTTYQGVGLELVANANNFFRYRTNPSILDVHTETFFLGNPSTQFISGSGGQLEISSSGYHIQPTGDITASRILIEGGTITDDVTILGSISANSILTPATIGGSPANASNASASISDQGLAIFRSASIAGFVINPEEIKSENENLRLKASGQITGSNVLLSGGTITDGVTILGSVTANSIQTPATIGGSPSTPSNASSSISAQGFAIFRSASIAGFTVNTEEIKSSDESLRLKSSGQMTGSSILLGDKAGGNFVQFAGSTMTVRGDISVDQIFTPATIGGSPATVSNASSSITSTGFAKFTSASIGGWDITTNSIEGGNLIMKPEGILQTKDFASGFKGWKISSEGNGTAEFENVRIRGTLRTTTFEKESVNAVGGQLWVTNATTISGSNVTANDTTMSVANASGFTVGEILLSKKVDGTGFQTEYLLVESASIDGDNTNADEVHGRIYVQRGYGSGSSGAFVGDLASTSQSYDEGQVIVSTGLSGSGYIKMNANPRDTATPFMDIVERTGSGLYDVLLKARLGDLSGIANTDRVFGSANPGFGLATDNVFLQGGIRATTGSIGGIEMESNKLYIGTGVHANSNTGFYVDSSSKFSLGDKLTWDGSALTVQGQLRLSSGQTVDDAINEATASNTAKTLVLTADSQVFAFPSASSTTATPTSIIFSIAQQNLSASISASDVTITTADGDAVTGFSFDTGSVTANSSTPPLYSGVVSGSLTFAGNLNAGGLDSDKTNLPVSIVATKDGLSDTTTIFKIEGGTSGSSGTDGTDGTDAITAFLTNESHTFPADVSGNISSFAGGTTEMKLFQGITDVTTDYTYTGSNTTGVTATSASNALTITGLSVDSGSVTFTAKSGSTTLSKIMSLAKSKQGSQGDAGSSAKLISVTTDSQIFSFASASSNVALDDDILIIINHQNLTSSPLPANITIKDQGGTTISNPTFISSSTSGTGQVSGSITFSSTLGADKSKLPISIEVSKDSVSDITRVFKVEGGTSGSAGTDGSDGSDAITAFLTNESHTFPADAAGTVSDFSTGTTDMVVFLGLQNVTSSFTFTGSNSLGVTATSSSKTLTVTGMAHDSGSIDFTAVSGSVSLTKTMTLSKSKTGQTGSTAKTLVLTSDSQVFSFPSASSSDALDDDILLIINQQNLSGAIGSGDITITDSGGSTLSDPSLVADVTNGSGQVSGSITFSSTVSGNKTKLPLTVTVTKDGLSDTTRIFKLEGGSSGSDGADGAAGADGSPAVTAFLTNEAHTFPADVNGNISSFAEASSSMVVFVGLTNSTSSFSFSRTNGLGVTSTLGGTHGNVLAISAMTHDSGSVDITATSASVSVTKTMTLAKSKQGAVGSTGQTGPTGPNFDFLTGSLSEVDTSGGLSKGLLMTSTVLGFHEDILEGDGTNATLNDFSSFLDNTGNFLYRKKYCSSFAFSSASATLLVSGSMLI